MSKEFELKKATCYHLYVVTDIWSWLSRVIRKLSKGQWSHSFIRVGPNLVFEAFHHVMYRKFSHYLDPEDVRKGWQFKGISSEVLNEAYEQLVKELGGQVYGFGQLLGFVYVAFWRRLGLHTSNPFKKRNVCSEVIYRFIEIVGKLSGGPHGERLRDMYPSRNDFTPTNQAKYLDKNTDLYEVVEEPKQY